MVKYFRVQSNVWHLVKGNTSQIIVEVKKVEKVTKVYENVKYIFYIQYISQNMFNYKTSRKSKINIWTSSVPNYMLISPERTARGCAVPQSSSRWHHQMTSSDPSADPPRTLPAPDVAMPFKMFYSELVWAVMLIFAIAPRMYKCT